MIRISSLIWTLILSLAVSGLGFFYIREEMRGFPLAFAEEVEGSGLVGSGFDANIWILLIDIVFWWFVFSILWIILKNYVFDL